MSIETGLIYRNSKPHLYSRQAAFPSLALLPNSEMLAAFAIASGFEASDMHTELARSHDGGRTWQLEGAVFHEGTADRPTSANVRISRMPDGELVAFGVRADRSRTDEGLTNPQTLGFVETELIMLRSTDDGRSWQGPEVIAPPLIGPAFELCSPVVPLRDGRWLWPTSTWKGWDGDNPTGMKAVALVSDDRGHSWPDYLDVMNGVADEILYWEQKIIELGDGRLLAVCWTHDLRHQVDLQVHYALSDDQGRSFGPVRPTGLHGQTSTPVALGDNRFVCLYRRTDTPGMWASYARIDGDAWINEAEVPLWGHDRRGAANIVGGENLSREFTTLKLGLPAGVLLPDGQVYAACWCVEECVYVIRWFRLPAVAPV